MFESGGLGNNALKPMMVIIIIIKVCKTSSSNTMQDHSSFTKSTLFLERYNIIEYYIKHHVQKTKASDRKDEIN